MYMPGRRLTGSSPSRTVMSFAVYAIETEFLVRAALCFSAELRSEDCTKEEPKVRAARAVERLSVGTPRRIPLGPLEGGQFRYAREDARELSSLEQLTPAPTTARQAVFARTDGLRRASGRFDGQQISIAG